MKSDADDWCLCVERTSRDGIRHFKLVSASTQLTFEASLELSGVRPNWAVHRIVVRPNSVADAADKTPMLHDESLIKSIIHGALIDFGTFYGDDRGGVACSVSPAKVIFVKV